ncbi:MAG: tetratricopeptide repeat protein [Nitrospirae bacterium]|nr:tetratricopeptide repeat protein [Magnetococcales bacterium]HAT49695.1 hypothetical protein [Alphaproteobacteria bacterium]
MDNLFEQIDEELDAERLRKQWEKNRPWIIGGFIVFFLSLFAYVGWDEHRKQQDAAASDLYMAAMKPYEQGTWSEAEKLIQPVLKQYGDHGYGILAQMVEARAMAEMGQTQEASSHMERFADQAKDDSLRDLALYNAALAVVDADGERVKKLLGRISDDSPFRSHALEILGLLAQKENDVKNAAIFYKKSIELGAKGLLRTRVDRRLERLGKQAKE